LCRCLLWGIAAVFRPKLLLIADNICLRQQLLVLHRRNPRPRPNNADRGFWILACRWLPAWRTSLLIVKPETVLRWHRQGWRTYWRRRSRRGGHAGRRPIAQELRGLIGRMAGENQLWGQRRIQAELARLGFKVSARTRRQLHASSQRPEAITGLAAIPEAARIDHLGVRFLLRPIDPLSDILRLLRDPSRQSASSPRPRDASPERRMDGTTDCRMLRLGPEAAKLPHS